MLEHLQIPPLALLSCYRVNTNNRLKQEKPDPWFRGRWDKTLYTSNVTLQHSAWTQARASPLICTTSSAPVIKIKRLDQGAQSSAVILGAQRGDNVAKLEPLSILTGGAEGSKMNSTHTKAGA